MGVNILYQLKHLKCNKDFCLKIPFTSKLKNIHHFVSIPVMKLSNKSIDIKKIDKSLTKKETEKMNENIKNEEMGKLVQCQRDRINKKVPRV